MIDMTKLDAEDKEFLENLTYGFSVHEEMEFGYAGKDYRIDYKDEKIMVYENVEGTPEYFFDDQEDFMEHFMLDGLPFKDRIPEIDSFGMI